MDINLTAKARPHGVTLIAVHGDIGPETTEVFKKKIEEIITSSTKKYIMDLQDVAYMNSVGVGAIAAALKKAKKFQGNIKLINVSSSIQELFEMTRLTKVFEIFTNEEEAIRSYGEN